MTLFVFNLSHILNACLDIKVFIIYLINHLIYRYFDPFHRYIYTSKLKNLSYDSCEKTLYLKLEIKKIKAKSEKSRSLQYDEANEIARLLNKLP